MKTLTLLWFFLVVCVSPVFATLGEKHIEAEKKSAADKGKAIVFYFRQAYYNPNCPKCIADVNANNAATKKALPRKYANIITIEAGGTRSLDKLPECVKAIKANAPILVATDAACTKVIGTLRGRPDRAQADAFEKSVAAEVAAAK